MAPCIGSLIRGSPAARGSVNRRSALENWLQAYTAIDPRERAFQTQMLELVRAPGDPFSRSHFVPGHFTASAFIVSPDRTAVLLILHAKLKRWLQPGGHVAEEDTDVLEASRREVAEEVGLTDLPLAQPGIFDLDVHPIPPLKQEPAHSHFDVRFAFSAPSLNFQAGSDARAARWVKLSDVSEVESDESVLRALRKL